MGAIQYGGVQGRILYRIDSQKKKAAKIAWVLKRYFTDHYMYIKIQKIAKTLSVVL